VGIKADPRRLDAKFDAAQTTPDNRKHWANADALSADAAASPSVRQIMRNRARYEVANNCYGRGIVLTLANDCIGTGPRLQMLSDNPSINQKIETEFAAWAKAVGLAAKLRTMRGAEAVDGEAFGMLSSNENLASPVKLDIRLIEADQVATPSVNILSKTTDGIVFDEYGNPIEYHVLKDHPGGSFHGFTKFDRVPAASIIHLYRVDRPGQNRGLPEIMPALDLFAQLRRFTKATLLAAETAAGIPIVMKTDAPAGGDAADVEPMTEMDFQPNTMIFTPEGWEPVQIKAEHPATTYDMFKREIINEIARCLNMPYNIAACNSSSYNYASGRLDHQTYFKSIRVEQSHIEGVVLDRILAAWLAEAVKVFDLPDFANASSGTDAEHQWFWEGREHVDPLKEAKAQGERLANHTTTLAFEYSRQGKDYETELRQRAKEHKLMDKLGLSPAQSTPTPTNQEEADDDEEEEIETDEQV